MNPTLYYYVLSALSLAGNLAGIFAMHRLALQVAGLRGELRGFKDGVEAGDAVEAEAEQ